MAAHIEQLSGALIAADRATYVEALSASRWPACEREWRDEQEELNHHEYPDGDCGVCRRCCSRDSKPYYEWWADEPHFVSGEFDACVQPSDTPEQRERLHGEDCMCCISERESFGVTSCWNGAIVTRWVI